jgi:hypothetical protein
LLPKVLPLFIGLVVLLPITAFFAATLPPLLAPLLLFFAADTLTAFFADFLIAAAFFAGAFFAAAFFAAAFFAGAFLAAFLTAATLGASTFSLQRALLRERPSLLRPVTSWLASPQPPVPLQAQQLELRRFQHSQHSLLLHLRVRLPGRIGFG